MEDENKSTDTFVSEHFKEDTQDSISDVTSVTQQNTPIPLRSPLTRSSSNLTIENLRRHEEAIIREDSLKGSSQSGRGTPLEALISGSPLVPVRTQSRQSSAGQKSQKSDHEPPNVLSESLRMGSGKPLPPIGVEKEENEEKTTEDISRKSEDDSNIEESRTGSSGLGVRSSHPSILQRPHRRESTSGEDLDRETVFSAKSMRSMTSRSERSVSFKEVNNGGNVSQSAERPFVKSPAVKEVHYNVVDGKEKVSVSIATETEWSWLESLKLAGVEEGKPSTPSSSHSQQRKALRKTMYTPSHDSNFSNMSAQMGEDSEEEEEETEREDLEPKTRVPPLEIDADPDDDEAAVVDTENLIPSIGPPRIIQYQRETDRPYTNQDVVIPEDDYDLGPIPGVSDTSLHLPEIQEEGAVCEYCHGEVKHFPTPEMRDNFSSEELYCCEEYQKFVEYAITNTPLSAQPSDELIDIAPHAPYGSKQARRAAKERAAARMREREIARQRAAGANQANFYALQVARQMKTINYSLSSQKCMDEGWTLRPETPDDSPPPPLAYEPVRSTTPPLARSFKGENAIPIVEKFFPSGQRFLVMFEDGSGTVFYSSGQPALHIIKVEKGQFLYIAQDEPEKGTRRGQLLALFEPQGRGTCYHKNGNIRLNMDQNEGSFADSKGAIKKRWHWWDHTTHVHAPPFQPICFALNSVLSVRCLAQDQIYLGFSQDKMNLRFNVGVKLKLIAPENIPEAEIDEDALYIADVRAYVQLVVDRISNQLHFSKSPKLGDIQPPRKLINDVIRNDRKKQENCRRKATGKDMPVVTVN